MSDNQWNILIRCLLFLQVGADAIFGYFHLMPLSKLKKLDRLSWWLDSSIKIPGTQYRMGVDSLVGFVPGIGDFLGILISGYIIVEAFRMGAPGKLLLRMGGNVALEALIGSIPIVGDIFDIAWKANNRNVRLLKNYLKDPKRVARNNFLIFGALFVAGSTFLVGGVFLLNETIQWLASA